METDIEKQNPNDGQLILVPHKDTIRLLEVYVKRSLSLNDGALVEKKSKRKEKWVTMPRKQRRHSSDPSLHLGEDLNFDSIGTLAASTAPATQPETLPATQPETLPAEPQKPAKKLKKKKKKKKPSLWKSFLGFFSRKGDEEPESSSEMPEASPEEEDSDAATTCVTTSQTTVQKKKSMRTKSFKRRFSKRRLSLKKSHRRESSRDLNVADITGVETVFSVEPTYSYYEKVTEELEKIVNEVKQNEEVESLTDEEVINRIIALTKEQGDAMDDKLKDNPTLSNFFQGMSYSAFQKLADAYLETETTTPTHELPTVLPTAPELVKLAFTLDFTARIAGLSRQNIGYITGLGNRYLQDRFKYQQACTGLP